MSSGESINPNLESFLTKERTEGELPSDLKKYGKLGIELAEIWQSVITTEGKLVSKITNKAMEHTSSPSLGTLSFAPSRLLLL